MAISTKKIPAFPVKTEYKRCVTALNCAGILSLLPVSASPGVTGIDGKEYPIPTKEQVVELFADNRELIERKVPQGFDRLELTPMAMSLLTLTDLLKAAIQKHAATGEIFQTRLSPGGPLVPVRINQEKQVWIWETLKMAFDSDRIAYSPQEYSSNHRGQTKQQVIHNRRICAFPGWSVGLAESFPVMPEPGQGTVLAGRNQLETGFSPNEYRELLQTPPYQGESGRTLEDFITGFMTRLETTGEVSNDVADNNAFWCLGQYMRVPYADLVPAGRWHRSVGRVRLDLHRSNNKQCTKSFGAATVVRLSGL